MNALVTVPELDHDAMMLREYNVKVSPNGRLERRVVANLIAHLASRGFSIVGVHDYEELAPALDTKAAMELIFNLDECNLHFKDAAGEEECLCLVLGNGHEIVSDWFFSDEDANGWNKAVESFDAEKFV